MNTLILIVASTISSIILILLVVNLYEIKTTISLFKCYLKLKRGGCTLLYRTSGNGIPLNETVLWNICIQIDLINMDSMSIRSDEILTLPNDQVIDINLLKGIYPINFYLSKKIFNFIKNNYYRDELTQPVNINSRPSGRYTPPPPPPQVGHPAVTQSNSVAKSNRSFKFLK